eukprot:gene28750-34709_t
MNEKALIDLIKNRLPNVPEDKSLAYLKKDENIKVMMDLYCREQFFSTKEWTKRVFRDYPSVKKERDSCTAYVVACNIVLHEVSEERPSAKEMVPRVKAIFGNSSLSQQNEQKRCTLIDETHGTIKNEVNTSSCSRTKFQSLNDVAWGKIAVVFDKLCTIMTFIDKISPRLMMRAAVSFLGYKSSLAGGKKSPVSDRFYEVLHYVVYSNTSARSGLASSTRKEGRGLFVESKTEKYLSYSTTTSPARWGPDFCDIEKCLMECDDSSQSCDASLVTRDDGRQQPEFFAHGDDSSLLCFREDLNADWSRDSGNATAAMSTDDGDYQRMHFGSKTTPPPSSHWEPPISFTSPMMTNSQEVMFNEILKDLSGEVYENSAVPLGQVMQTTAGVASNDLSDGYCNTLMSCAYDDANIPFCSTLTFRHNNYDSSGYASYNMEMSMDIVEAPAGLGQVPAPVDSRRWYEPEVEVNDFCVQVSL